MTNCRVESHSGALRHCLVAERGRPRPARSFRDHCRAIVGARSCQRAGDSVTPAFQKNSRFGVVVRRARLPQTMPRTCSTIDTRSETVSETADRVQKGPLIIETIICYLGGKRLCLPAWGTLRTVFFFLRFSPAPLPFFFLHESPRSLVRRFACTRSFHGLYYSARVESFRR